jgi:RNA polymerase sigma factor (sigma-70 family)
MDAVIQCQQCGVKYIGQAQVACPRCGALTVERRPPGAAGPSSNIASTVDGLYRRVVCTGCLAGLVPPVPVAAGQPIQCLKCRSIFTAPGALQTGAKQPLDPAPADDASEEPAANPIAVRRSATSAEPGKVRRRSWRNQRGDAEDWEDRPISVRRVRTSRDRQKRKDAFWTAVTPRNELNDLLEGFCAYLETLTFIHVDPRVRGEISMSDIIQVTLMEASREWEALQSLDSDICKRKLRKMFVNNLLDQIDCVRTQKRGWGHKESLDAALQESSWRLLKDVLAVEETPPLERVVKEGERLRLLEALSKLDPRQREALILQKYHGLTLAEIAEHLGCTIGAVAGLQARGLEKLRKRLTAMRVTNA